MNPRDEKLKEELWEIEQKRIAETYVKEHSGLQETDRLCDSCSWFDQRERDDCPCFTCYRFPQLPMHTNAVLSGTKCADCMFVDDYRPCLLCTEDNPTMKRSKHTVIVEERRILNFKAKGGDKPQRIKLG